MDLRTWLQARQPPEPPRDGALGDHLGITPAAVRHKANGLRQVQLTECVPIEQFTAGQVRCEDLRPDVEWERDADGRVVSYRVPVSMVATVDPDPSTVDPANAGAVEESNQ